MTVIGCDGDKGVEIISNYKIQFVEDGRVFVSSARKVHIFFFVAFTIAKKSVPKNFQTVPHSHFQNDELDTAKSSCKT